MRQQPNRNFNIIVGLGLVALPLLAACGGGDSDAAAPSDEVEDIRLSLDWNAYMAYHAPLVAGIEEGIFENHGVRIEEMTLPGGSSDAVTEVGSGRTDMGWVDLSTAAASMLQELPITSVGNVQASNASGLTVLEGTPIDSVEDIKGMRIGSTPGGSDSTLTDAFLNANNLTRQDIEIVSMPGDGKFPALMVGDVDAISGQNYYYTSLLEEEGESAESILYAELGLEGLLDHGFVANDEFIESNPEAIADFLAAYRESLQFTIDDPVTACSYVVDASDGTMEQELCETQLELWLPLAVPPEDNEWGINHLEDWETTVHIHTEYGDAQGDREPESMFTNEFLQEG